MNCGQWEFPIMIDQSGRRSRKPTRRRKYSKSPLLSLMPTMISMSDKACSVSISNDTFVKIGML